MKIKLQDPTGRCTLCRRCLLHCPEKAIRFTDRKSELLPELCSGCGRCLTACPKELFAFGSVRDDIRRLLGREVPVYACYDAWMEQLFSGTDLSALLLRLGLTGAESTAEMELLLKQETELVPGRTVISAHCPVVNFWIKNQIPEAVGILAPLCTPAEALGRKIKTSAPEAKVLYITACPAQCENQDLDMVMSLNELFQWLREAAIRITPPPFLVTSDECGQTVRPHLRAEGKRACLAAVRSAVRQELPAGVLELYACAGGCSSAPGMEGLVPAALLASEPKEHSLQLPDHGMELRKLHEVGSPVRPEPESDALRSALKALGIHWMGDCPDCGLCGYGTCLAAARGILDGTLEPGPCPRHRAELEHAFLGGILDKSPDGILLLDEDLGLRAINRQGRRLLCRSAADDPFRINLKSVLAVDQLLSAMRPDYVPPEDPVMAYSMGKYLEQRTCYLREYGLLLCFLLDRSRERRAVENQRQVATTASVLAEQVLRRNLEMVRQITSILGESAARNENDLVSLKEFVDNV